jgi:medium-chain acyl-[acyl-carrier-protein] hydrolase
MLPPDVEVIAVQLPGREDRFREQAFTSVDLMVRTVMVELRPYLDGSFSFFGHSGGALLAYELAHALRARRRTLPMHLFVSGQAPPDIVRGDPPIHTLKEAEFREAIRVIGGLTNEVWSNNELMDILAPALRADFALYETHEFPARPALPTPIIALGGRADSRVSMEKLEAWRIHTSSEFSVVMFEGDHFYLNGPNKELLSELSGILLRTIGAAERAVST